ncbi:MAG: hypothetical protein EZS28_002747, partial [Streblomastix strix]
SFIVTKPLDEIKEGLVSINNMANEFIGFAQDSLFVEDNINETYDNSTHNTKSLIRPILVTLYYFQDILSNNTDATNLFTSIGLVGADKGPLQEARDGMIFGHATLSWMQPTTSDKDLILLDNTKDFQTYLDLTFNTITDRQALQNLINEATKNYTCTDFPLLLDPKTREAECNASMAESADEKTKIEWLNHSASNLNDAFNHDRLTQLEGLVDNVLDAAERNKLNPTLISVTNQTFLDNVKAASVDFSNLASQIISSLSAANQATNKVNDQIGDAQKQVNDQTKKVTDQVNKYENYVQDKIIDRYYDKYMEESPYKLKSLIKSLAILFGILLIFWFALIVIQAFISIFCAKSGLLGCCICSEFTILAVFGIVLIILSLIACILGDVTKFIYGPDAIGYLTGNRILRKGSSALSQLNITQPEVKDLLIYYYGPTEAEAENPVRTPLTRFIDEKIQGQDMVDEVFPREDGSHSMVIQKDLYSKYVVDHPEYAPASPPLPDPPLPLLDPEKNFSQVKIYNEPYYCNISYQYEKDGTTLNKSAEICYNVLADTTQAQMDTNKTAFWKKFDEFVDETIGLVGYESISSTGYFLVDTIFITLEGGFMYFYIGMIIVFLFSIPHIICMSSGRTYWTKYVPRPKEDKKREGYKVEEMDEIEVEDDIQEEEQEVLTTNDSGQLVVMVVKTKKGQAQQMRPQERDRENKMLDDLFRNDNTEAIIHPQQGQGGTSSRNRNQPGSVQSVGFNAAIQPWVYSQQMNPEDAQLMSYTDNGFVPQPDPLDTYGMDGVDDGFNVISANQNVHKQQGFYPKGPYHTGYEGD